MKVKRQRQIISSSVSARCKNMQLLIEYIFFLIFRCFRKISKSNCYLFHVCRHGIAWLALHRFSWNFVFEVFFRKSVHKIRVSLKSGKNNQYLKTYPWYLAMSWNEIFSDKALKKITTHFTCNNFFSKILPCIR